MDSSIATLSQLFPVFTPYSCQWRDCALGELLISSGNIIIIIILFYLVSDIYFMFIILSGLNSQKNSCKNVEQWRNSVIPHYLVVNHCNADDFELGEPFIVHLWLESVQYSLLFILRKFQVEIPKIYMSNDF